MGDEEVKDPKKLACCPCCQASLWIRLLTWTKIGVYSLMILAMGGNILTRTLQPQWLPHKLADAFLSSTIVTQWVILTLPTPLILLIAVKVIHFFPQFEGLHWPTFGKGGEILIGFGITIFLLLVGIIMAIILLQGVKKKGEGLLRVWMGYEIICMLLTVLEAAAGIILDTLGIGHDPLRLIGRVMLAMFFQGFDLGLVLKFKTKIVEEREKKTISAILTPLVGKVVPDE